MHVKSIRDAHIMMKRGHQTIGKVYDQEQVDTRENAPEDEHNVYEIHYNDEYSDMQ
jgi:hypothetical protein